MATRHTAARRAGLGLSALLGGWLAFAPAAADEAAATPDRGPARPARRAVEPLHPRIEPARARLQLRLQNADVQLESLSAFHGTRAPGDNDVDHVMFEPLTDAVYREAWHETRRAIRDYLFEVASIDDAIDNLRRRAARHHSAEPARQGGRKRLDFDLGIHSATPEVEMRYRTFGGDVTFGVSADGEIGLNFRARSAQRAEVGVGFDGRDSFRFNFALGF